MSAGARPLRIGIDVRYLSHALLGGVHTYVKRLVPALLELAPADSFVLYADEKAPFELSPPKGVLLRTLSWRHSVSTMVNDWRLARHMAADDIDVAFHPTNYGFGPAHAATVVTVHDALNLLPLSQTLRGKGSMRNARTAAMTVYLHLMTSRAVARATMLLTISEHARVAIAKASGRDIDDIVAVHHGASPTPIAPVRVDDVVRRHGLRTPYILADGLKNPGTLIGAWRRLDPAVRRGYALVFFARHANVLPVLQEATTAGEARLLVRPASEELAALYAGAAAFVFPSWIEGFGLPLLEAMSHGTPIVASDRGSIPEVVGPAALLVDAEDASALASALARVLTNDGEAARLRAAGRARVSQFTWRRAAEQTMAVLCEAHARRQVRSAVGSRA